MAVVVKEFYYSGVGATVEPGVGLSTELIYTVQTSGPLVDPIRAIQTQIPPGHPHPRGQSFAGTFAAAYRVDERLAPTYWRVSVLYRPPIVIAAGGRWQKTFQSASEVERIIDSYDDPPKRIGVPAYRPVPSGGTHRAAKRDGTTLSLVRTEARTSDGIDRDRPVVSMTLRRIQANFFEERVGAIASFKSTVNGAIFFGAGVGQLRFLDFGAEQQEGSLSGQLELGVVWSVQLHFLWNPDGHQFKATHVYRDDDGYESLVTNIAGEPVVENFTRYKTADYSTLLAQFE
jgi:hypothetical protein